MVFRLFSSSLRMMLIKAFVFLALFILPLFCIKNPVFAGMIGTHVGEFDLGTQINILRMIKSKNVPAGYPVTIVVELFKSPEEINNLAQATSGLKPVVRIARIETSTTRVEVEKLANALNGISWPQGSKPIIVFGNEMNNLDANREWGPNPPTATNVLSPIQNAGVIYRDLFKYFNDALDNSYPLAAQPPDMYNGNASYNWSDFVTYAGSAYGSATAFVANVYDIEPGKLDRWTSFPQQYQKSIKFFTEYGPSPSLSIREHIQFLTTHNPPDGIDATTLIPNKCTSDEGSWLWYINGKVYDITGSNVDPASCSTTGGNSSNPMVLRDCATLLSQEGFDAASGCFSNYSMSCSAMKTFEGKLTGQNATIVINGVETSLKNHCEANPGDSACIFQPSGDFLASISEKGKIPIYSSDNVGKRNTSFMDFTTNQSTGDFIDTAAWYKFSSPEDQCVQNINIMRGVYQICQTLPAISYKELVSGGTGGVLAATSDGGMCPIDTTLTTSKGPKLITDVYAQIKNIQDLDPNDDFKNSEDFCNIAYQKRYTDSEGSEVYQETQKVLDYVKKVSMFRNVYEVGYIVYVRDFVPTKKTFLELLFPFFSFDNSNRNEIPIQVQPYLSPYGLASKRTIESDKGDRPRDYVTGLYNTTFEAVSDPEIIREQNNKEVEQIDKVQASYAKGYPDETEENKETCATYICCPKCKKILEQKSGTHETTFNQDTFKAILGAYINKNIEAGTASTFNTRIGLQNNEGLAGNFNTCRVSQKDINGETAKKLGSSLVQESIYPSIIQSVFNFLGIIKVGGAGASPDSTTSIRVFVISPDEARSLQTTEGNNVAKFLNPDYIDYMNKTIKDVEEGKVVNAKNPLFQMYGIDQGFSSNDDSRGYDKPGSGATPAPNTSPTPTPQVEVVGGIKLKEEQSKDGEGGVVAGGIFGRELFTLLGNILSAPDSPTYAENYTTFEDYWSGKDKKETGL